MAQTSLPTDYQEFIAISKYARWLPEQNRRETWDETVNRYISFFQQRFNSIISKNGSDSVNSSSNIFDSDSSNYVTFDDIKHSITSLKVMPSMRTLMTAGPALERDNVAGYNCLAPETLVVTKEYGQVPIELLANSQQSVHIIDAYGKWEPTVFRSYGIQTVVPLKFKLNSNTERVIEATLDHNWLLVGDIKTSKELKEGDRIAFYSAPRNVNEDSIDYRLGVMHGLVYGDGTTIHSCERVKGYLIRLASDADVLLNWFKEYSITYPPSANGDPVVMLYDGFAKTHGLKHLPSINETDDYLIGFIRGWMAADGAVTKSSQVSICMGKEDKDWFKIVAPKLGFVVQREYKQSAETNFGKRKHESWNLYISRSSLTKRDFIIPRKAKRFKPLISWWTFDSQLEGSRETEVYCCEVESTHSFTISDGLHTGNCAYQAIKGRGKELSIFNDEIEEIIGQPIIIHLKNPITFDEIMYILLCGTGDGFSVERQYINELPTVGKNLSRRIYYKNNSNFPGVDKSELSRFDRKTNTIIVEDSKYGWASALRILIVELYNGHHPKWDLSKVRPAGTPLKIFGGRASGPGPLDELFRFTSDIFNNAKGRKLNSLECHDIICKIADTVVVGGVRRSACLSLSNLSDNRMKLAKSGNFYLSEPQRRLANNSVCYTEKPDALSFIKEWSSLIESGSGERGVFNRIAAQKTVARNGRRDPNHDWGTNPCSEIILRDQQFCNLSEVVVRSEDTIQDLEEKVRIATILGTLQATLTDFKYLNPQWRINTEEEALLGVSLTGIMDHPILNGGEKWIVDKRNGNIYRLPDLLTHLKNIAIEVNKELAAKLGINQAAAISCVKPSGTVSQLVNSASGIHPRHSQYYIRTVRADNLDPLCQMMKDIGIPWEPDKWASGSTTVFSFPIKSPENAVFRDNISAIDQLNHWLVYQRYWCEHKPSITVNVKDHEWLEVGAWIYEHFDEVSGISCLPHSEHIYEQAPYQDITEEEYIELESKMPKNIDWSILSNYEKVDNTKSTQTYACTGNVCEIVDL